MFIKNFIFCSTLIFISFSCLSQQQEDERYAVKNFEKIDTMILSPDYQYKYYRNRTDPSILMEDVFSDSAKLKMVGRRFLKNGIHTGPCIFYTDEGDALTTGYYLNDKKDGQWLTYYYGQKKVKQEQYYNKGQRSGTWKTYDETGKLTSEETYDGAGNRTGKKIY